jgi:hypothetical protein
VLRHIEMSSGKDTWRVNGLSALKRGGVSADR